ncbi:MAG: hypothetical protein OXG25_10305 [Gammaproteobacteria bacterium]|nr:hypothetical protein [Gammaproteobacteria bacterium]
MPARPDHILYNLNGTWFDERGLSFRVIGDHYSANEITATHDLSNDKSLIIGTMGHAFVLNAMSFVEYPTGYRILSAVVRDPWANRARRTLSPQEWAQISFAVRIEVHRLR